MKNITFFLILFCCSYLSAQNVFIPDANFKNALLNHNPTIDTNGDGEIQVGEASVVAHLIVSSSNITDLTGISSFDNLLFLECQGNQLTTLPALPSSLTYLYCGSNQLTSLPALPSNLSYLSCNNNPNLSCLPFLPSTLWALDISNTTISCLPNQNGYTSTFGLPLCTSTTQICHSQTWVEGKVYFDANINNVHDNGEDLLEGFVISANQNGSYALSQSNLGYLLNLDDNTNYTLNSSNLYPNAFNIVPPTYNITTTTGQVSGNFDFGLQPIPNVSDVELSITNQVARPGFVTSATATIHNIGSILQNNLDVTIDIPIGWAVQSTNPVGGVVSGNTVTWSGVNLALFESANYTVYVEVPASTPLGTLYNFIVTTVPNNLDYYFSAAVTGIVVGSYDPNDKNSDKPNLPANYATTNEEILYTIRFQNTGTASAINVRVEDLISQDLNFSTFRMVSSSHPCNVFMSDDEKVIFSFPNINLIDMTTNEPLSHGFVKFAIKPIAGLLPGADVTNSADIFFDFNTPITTNTAHSTISCLNATIASSNGLDFCEGETTLLTSTVSGGTGTYTYTWDNGQVTAGTSVTPPTNATLYQLTITESGGCPALTRAVVLNVNERPEPNYFVYIDPHGAPLFDLYAINDTDVSHASCHWDFGDGSTSNDDYPTHIYDVTGIYQVCLTVTDDVTGCDQVFCDSIGVDSLGNIYRDEQGFTLNIFPPSITGVQLFDESHVEITAFPNPNNGKFELAFSGAMNKELSLMVTDITGRIVLRRTIDSALHTDKISVNLSNQPTGVYFVKLSDAHTSNILKVVVCE